MALAPKPAFAEFGIAAFDQQIVAGPAGDAFTQAGGHPYEISTEIDFNHHEDADYFGQPKPDADVKDVVTNIPPGLIGNPSGIPQCTEVQLVGRPHATELFRTPECAIGSQVGTIALRTELSSQTPGSLVFPLYNMVPPPDMPAAFGFQVVGQPIILSGNVRNGGDFGVTIASRNIPITLPLDGITLTFWGVPADPRHDSQRCDYGFFGLPGTNAEDAECVLNPLFSNNTGPHSYPGAPKAFLTMPASCTPPGVGLETNLQIDSWPAPGVWDERNIFSHLAPGYPLAPAEWGLQKGTTGCEIVPFNPSISVEPTNTQADTPTGLNVEISLPQEGLSNPSGITTADVKDAVVTLPAGESVSPSAADGLGACTPEQVGLNTGQPAACPDSSKLGTVEIDTPLLETPLHGAIYLGKPECGPCAVSDDLEGRLVKLYVVVEGHGVILKLPGRVEMDPTTGRIVTRFDNNPQLPFDHFKLNFKAGPRSPLVNPHACGTYETTAVLTPWSGNAAATVSDSFQITSGPGGKPCPTSTVQSFSPSFVAGTPNNQAGAFSPLTVSFTRADGEQQLAGVVVKMPPGLLGVLTGIPLCQEPQASAGSCSAASEIGGLTVSAGAGANPFYVHGGKVFLTGGYKGGEFGLSIVVPAVAGPFDLGTVVVRGSIKLDPVTTALTVSTDPLPTILDGIPLDLRTVNVQIDRPGFIFNPTDCDSLSLSGTLTGGLGTQSLFNDSFQVTNCGRLGFSPRFTVTTPGKTSRANGAGLKARIVYPKGAQANIAKVKVNLPKQLPSRLTTLQKACDGGVFASNPDNCPSASKIGFAKAVTPILPVPLEGPAYFVSHGGLAFPDLVIALKGYGIDFHLVGTTFISKAGITSTSFKQVPDVPIETFELTLPQGPNSALAANGNLCKSKLVMPTEFTAQNGAVLNQSTRIEVESCSNALSLISKKLHGKTLTLRVNVPAAGQLSASGKGLSKSTKSSSGRETIAVKLRVSRNGKFATKVMLVFSPKSGGDLSRSGRRLSKSIKIKA
jgi:hypothetical protein